MAEAPEPTVTVLDCVICLENLNDPRILPCSHCFCDTCISEYILSTVSHTEQKSFNCPTCRNIVNVEDPSLDKSKWASFLPLKSESGQETNVERPSVMKNKQNCHPCESDRFIEACVWCKECNEALCRSCSDAHSRLKMTKSHTTVPIENIDEDNCMALDKILEANEMCSVHENKIIEVFCFDHSEMCCVLCLNAKHKKCENTRCFDEVEEIQDENIINLQTDIQGLISQLRMMAEQNEENKITLMSLFQAVENEACAVVTEMKNKIDQLHKGFCKTAKLLQEEAQNDLSSNVKQIKDCVAVLESSETNVRLVTSFGSKFQMFVTNQKIKSELFKFSKDIELLVNHHKKVTLTTDFRKLQGSLNAIDTLGNLTLFKNDYEPSDTQSFSNFRILKFRCVKFETVALKALICLDLLLKKAILSVVNIGNQLCAVLFGDKSVNLIHLSSKIVVDSVVIDGSPKRLCYNNVTNTLYVTCNHNLGFTYKIDGSKLGDCKSHKFDNMICGIDTCDDDVFIITKNAVLKSNGFTKKHLFMSATIDGASDDIAVDGQSGRLAVLSCGTSNIHFTTMESKYLQPFFGNDKLKNVNGIAFGPSGLLFVAENNLCSIRVISKDEKNIRTLVTKFEKLTSLDNIHVDKENFKLYVCGTGYVEIYDIQ